MKDGTNLCITEEQITFAAGIWEFGEDQVLNVNGGPQKFSSTCYIGKTREEALDRLQNPREVTPAGSNVASS